MTALTGEKPTIPEDIIPSNGKEVSYPESPALLEQLPPEDLSDPDRFFEAVAEAPIGGETGTQDVEGLPPDGQGERNADELPANEAPNSPTENDFLLARVASGELTPRSSSTSEGGEAVVELVNAQNEVVGVLPSDVNQEQLVASTQQGETARGQFSTPEELQLHGIQARLASGELRLVPNTVTTDPSGNEHAETLNVVDAAGNIIFAPSMTEVAQHGLQQAFQEGQARYFQPAAEDSGEPSIDEVKKGADVEPTVQKKAVDVQSAPLTELEEMVTSGELHLILQKSPEGRINGVQVVTNAGGVVRTLPPTEMISASWVNEAIDRDALRLQLHANQQQAAADNRNPFSGQQENSSQNMAIDFGKGKGSQAASEDPYAGVFSQPAPRESNMYSGDGWSADQMKGEGKPKELQMNEIKTGFNSGVFELQAPDGSSGMWKVVDLSTGKVLKEVTLDTAAQMDVDRDRAGRQRLDEATGKWVPEREFAKAQKEAESGIKQESTGWQKALSTRKAELNKQREEAMNAEIKAGKEKAAADSTETTGESAAKEVAVQDRIKELNKQIKKSREQLSSENDPATVSEIETKLFELNSTLTQAEAEASTLANKRLEGLGEADGKETTDSDSLDKDKKDEEAIDETEAEGEDAAVEAEGPEGLEKKKNFEDMTPEELKKFITGAKRLLVMLKAFRRIMESSKMSEDGKSEAGKEIEELIKAAEVEIQKAEAVLEVKEKADSEAEDSEFGLGDLFGLMERMQNNLSEKDKKSFWKILVMLMEEFMQNVSKSGEKQEESE